MSPGEAWRLTQELLGDPSSHVFAAMAEWDYPLSREGLLLADLWDLLWQSFARKGRFKPHPRPYSERTSTRTKPSASLTQAEIIAALRAAGHTAALPTKLAHLEEGR